MKGQINTAQGRMILITGLPGTGKTAVSAMAARETYLEKSVHMHTDDFMGI